MVLDNNCVIAGLTTFGAARELLAYLARGEILVAISDEIEAEYLDVNDRKSFRRLLDRVSLSTARYRVRLADVIGAAQRFSPEGEAPECRDPGDRKYLHCAVFAGADFLVTRDLDLLTLETIEGTRILTPEDLLAHLRNPSTTP